MRIFDKLREKRRKRKSYNKLLEICSIEAKLGVPYEEALPPAFMYLEAGEYELYFKDLETVKRNYINKQLSKVVEI